VDAEEANEHSAALAARTTLIQFCEVPHVVSGEMGSCSLMLSSHLVCPQYLAGAGRTAQAMGSRKE